jgi:molybdopterin biosynthesis enzyme
MAAETEPQRIARLTPLLDVLARIDALVQPVPPRPVETAAALGRVLAEDAVPAAGWPLAATALRDGFAVSSEATSDASSYMPAPLAAPAPVHTGDRLPPGADAVAPLDVVVVRGGKHAIIAPVAPGDGVLATHADVAAGAPLRRTGQRLRSVDVAVLGAAGLAQVSVREPRIRLILARAGDDAMLAAARGIIARSLATEGAAVLGDHPALGGDLAAALGDQDADAIIAIGGTGSGGNDGSVHALARLGRVETHGIAIMPGETAAFGFVGQRPVLLLPGRIDGALAVWLLVGRHLLAKMSGHSEEIPAATARLARKVASPLGMAEAVPVRRRGKEVESIASGYWPLHAIAQADGWILVPPDSEGYPAGAEVVIRPWP